MAGRAAEYTQWPRVAQEKWSHTPCPLAVDGDQTDNVGLDSTTGLSVSKLGGGTYNITIAAVISKVADTPANGGAGVVFANGSDGAVSDCMS